MQCVKDKKKTEQQEEKQCEKGNKRTEQLVERLCARLATSEGVLESRAVSYCIGQLKVCVCLCVCVCLSVCWCMFLLYKSLTVLRFAMIYY